MREKSSVEVNLIPDRQISTDLSSLFVLKKFLAPYKFRLFLSILSLVVAALMVLAMGWGIKYLIDYGFAHDNAHHLNQVILFLMVCVLIMSIASFGRSYLVAWIGEKVAADIREKVFAHLLTLEVAFFEFTRPGELISRLTADITLLQILVGTSAAVAVRNIFLFGGGFAMMMTTSAKLTLFAFMIVPMVLIPIIFYGKRVRYLSRLSQDTIGDMGGFLEEVLGSVRSCQAFVHEKFAIAQFNCHSEDTVNAATARLMMRSWLSCLVIVLVFAGVCVVLWIGGQDVLNDELSAGSLSAFIFYAITVAASAGSFSEIYADLQRAAGAMERLSELLLTSPTIISPEKLRTLPTPARGVIALHNVTFAYPTNPEHQVLKNVTLSLAPGEKVAIVGPSGSGKSTILSLLLRFYDFQSGSIYIDGIDMREASLSELRDRFSIVPQDPVIFSKNLYDNILYGNPEASEIDVWKAIEAAHLTDVIKNLPQGIYTPLGHRGVILSGGQKQRIAIARAILRNSPILLLDEATSALDVQSEQLIQDSLNQLMATRTTLVVAHRLATVLKADRIIVLNKGIVEAVGTHAELISEDGLYRRLATLQFTDSLDFTKKFKDQNHR